MADDASQTVSFREATDDDLPRIVGLLADDPLGSRRERFEDPLPPEYEAAFEVITRDPNNELIVACVGEEVVGVLQLTFIPGLSRLGSWRCQIEGVRVDGEHRSLGIGKRLLSWALTRARERDCRLVQLTTDKMRPEALKFYERFGFEATHLGLKLQVG